MRYHSVGLETFEGTIEVAGAEFRVSGELEIQDRAWSGYFFVPLDGKLSPDRVDEEFHRLTLDGGLCCDVQFEPNNFAGGSVIRFVGVAT